MTQSIKPIRPPKSQYGPYSISGKSVFFETKDNSVEIMTGRAWVMEPVLDLKTGYVSYVVQIVPLVGMPTTTRILPKDMTAAKLAETLGNHGNVIHHPNHVQKYLQKTASEGEFAEKAPSILIESPGWFSGVAGFYTGTRAIMADHLKESDFRFEPVRNSPISEKGTLVEWQEHVGQHIECNFIVLTISCIGIASLFLKQMNLSSRLTNYWGGKGTGKTLGIQCGASIFGNAIDPAAGRSSDDVPNITKFSSTTNGIEVVLARYSPFPLALDEATEQSSESFRELAYKLSSGEGKHRMDSKLNAAKAHSWHLAIITTAEIPLAEALAANGKPVLGGMSDRVVDVAIDGCGMFQNFGKFESFKLLTKHLKDVCGKYYGAAGRALLTYAVNNPQAVEARLEEADDIEERLMPDGCGDGERRVVKLFAAAVAAGNIAIDAGVFHCEPSVIEDAFKRITKIWWHSRGGVLHTIAQFLIDNEKHVIFEEPCLNKQPKAFVTDTLVIIPDHEFNKAFGHDAKKMIDQLCGLNALIREQPNRNKHRFCNNSMFAYVIPLSRLESIIGHLTELQEKSESEAGNGNTDELEE